MNKHVPAWTWIPSLYFVEGIPYLIVNVVALIMYKRLDLSDSKSALFVSLLSLPWVLKPLWSPVVEIFKTKRWWIIMMQMFMAIALTGVAFSIPTAFSLQLSMTFFFLIAFCSATHDIAADGFYMLALNEHEQALNVGVRSTFYRLAVIAGEGLLVMLIGLLEVYTRRTVTAWSLGMGGIALLMAIAVSYHAHILPHVSNDGVHRSSKHGFEEAAQEFGLTFISFFKKPQLFAALAFMLLYRFPEALLTKICPLFLTAKVKAGGLGLSTSQFGFSYGTVGVIGLTLGGILGGIVVARDGFRKWRWPMVLALSLPNCAYIFLAYLQPTNLGWINTAIVIEQFGYGFGFTLYMLFLLYYSQGESKAAHYALCTGFMALGLMLPGMGAGWLAEKLGYYNSFILVMALVPVTFVVTSFIRVPDSFGQKKITA